MYINNKKLFLYTLLLYLCAELHATNKENYTSLSSENLKNASYETKKSGEYIIINNKFKAHESIKSDTLIEGIKKDNVLIAVTKDNVTIDLNDETMHTDKPGFIAIAIADKVSGTTIKNGRIKNGNENFQNAILIGRHCSNITLENITIEGNSNKTHKILDFRGSPNYPIQNITLKNIAIYKSSTEGIHCAHVNNLYMENVTCSSLNSENKLAAISLNNCKYITCKNIQSTLNKGTSETIGFKIKDCKDGKFTNILCSSNQDNIDGPHTKNIHISHSYNLTFTNIESTNTKHAECNLCILHSKNITISKALICNNNSATGEKLIGIKVTGSYALNINNCSITNNTGATHFHAISCDTTTSTDINFNNIEIASNKALNGDFKGLFLPKSEFVTVNNLVISQNQSTQNTYGLKATNETKNLLCSNCTFIYNKSTTDQDNKTVAGIFVDGSLGVRLKNCISNYNNGATQTFGYYIADCDACELMNCKAQLNWASPAINQGKPSAGFFLNKCNYCTLKKCVALNNKGGNYAPGNGGSKTINLDTCCGGFGLMNKGENIDNPNIGCQFIDCHFDGNRTQLPNTDPGNKHQSYHGSKRRYWESQALAAGAIEYHTQQSIYKSCTFNNNGTSNYVSSSGLLITNGSINTFVDSCVTSNNRFYGYVDLNTKCETFFIGCVTLGNGSYNDVATRVTSSQTSRNAKINYGSRKPFYVIKMDDYSGINNRNSPIHNYNIIGRRSSDEDD